MADGVLDVAQWDGCDLVNVCVVVQNRKRRGLGDCGDKEIGHLTSPEPVGREFAL